MSEAQGIRSILVGVDGSDASVEALRQARVLAEPFHARVTALACWDFPPVYDGYVAWASTTSTSGPERSCRRR